MSWQIVFILICGSQTAKLPLQKIASRTEISVLVITLKSDNHRDLLYTSKSQIKKKTKNELHNLTSRNRLTSQRFVAILPFLVIQKPKRNVQRKSDEKAVAFVRK
jgi:hypothetical protein